MFHGCEAHNSTCLLCNHSVIQSKYFTGENLFQRPSYDVCEKGIHEFSRMYFVDEAELKNISSTVATSQLFDGALSVFRRIPMGSMRQAINGVRTIVLLLSGLPTKSDLSAICEPLSSKYFYEGTFAPALRLIKRWAQRRAIYGNIFGLLTGVSLAVLVARTCQLVPCGYPSVVIRFFFRIMTHFFSQKGNISPIFTVRSVSLPDSRVPGVMEGSLSGQILPIPSPAYPFSNTAHTCSRGSFRLICEELAAAAQYITQEDETGSFPLNPVTSLLCRYPSFVFLPVAAKKRAGIDTVPSDDFDCFLFIDSLVVRRNSPNRMSPSFSTKLLSVWSGFVESRLRFLIYSLEASREASFHIASARPFPSRIERTIDCGVFGDVMPSDGLNCATLAVGISLRNASGERIPNIHLFPDQIEEILRPPINDFCFALESAYERDEAPYIEKDGVFQLRKSLQQSECFIRDSAMKGPFFRILTSHAMGEKRSRTHIDSPEGDMRLCRNQRPAIGDSRQHGTIRIDESLMGFGAKSLVAKACGFHLSSCTQTTFADYQKRIPAELTEEL